MRTLISMQRPLPSFRNIQSSLLLEEAAATTDDATPSALVATSGSAGSKPTPGNSQSGGSGSSQPRNNGDNSGNSQRSNNNNRRRNYNNNRNGGGGQSGTPGMAIHVRATPAPAWASGPPSNIPGPGPSTCGLGRGRDLHRACLASVLRRSLRLRHLRRRTTLGYRFRRPTRPRHFLGCRLGTPNSWRTCSTR